MYSEKVIDHFTNPRNVGEIENADGIGEAGNPVCGDIMKIYLKIENESSTNIQFYPYNSMVQQGNKQYDYEENWEAQYEQISDDILPGVVSEGVVTFPAIDLNGGDVRFVFEGLSDDYNVEFETFIFECPLQP